MASISNSYFKNKTRKFLATGGNFDPDAIAGGAGILSGGIDALAPVNGYGRQATGAMAASGALRGAASGSSLGPLGMAAGALIGGAAGLFGGMSAKREENKMLVQQNIQLKQREQAAMNARLMANPELTTGSMSAQYFANGGQMGPGDPPVKKALGDADYNNWNNVVRYARTKKLDPAVLDHDPKVGYGVIDEYNKANPTAAFDRSRVQDIQSMMLDYREKSIARMKAVPEDAQKSFGYPYKQFGADYSGFMKGLSKADNFPGSKTLDWEVPDEYRTHKGPDGTTRERVGFAPDTKAMGGKLAGGYRNTPAAGGSIVQMSSDGAEVQGQTHAEGGVQVPGRNAEVEDKETMKDDFVYSAQLGFAQQHKPLMKAKGIIEQKAATPERINALRLIEQKEDTLAMAQEYFKKKHGIR